MADFYSILNSASTIAVVGCSDDPWRTSYGIARYLLKAGFQVVPVNPNHESVMGMKCYADLKSIPPEVKIDIVDIFRAREHSAEMVQMAIDFSKERGIKPVIWTQLHVSSPDAEKLAADAGLTYIKNRCIKIEHRALSNFEQ